MVDAFDRHLRFNSVYNFRDIGGYRGHRGKTVAWRRIFRSGEFRHVTREDLDRLTKELGVNYVLDLRSELELKNGGKGLLAECDIKYCNIAFMTDGGDPEANAKRYSALTNMGDFYVELARQKEYGAKIVRALEVIADSSNHPLVFHCAVGKDRTGMLAAMLLKLLGVREEDIIEDYTLSEPYMDELLAKLKANPNPKEGEGVPNIPEYFWKASAPSMKILLGMLKKEYGGVEKYLLEMGMSAEIPKRLQTTLLT
jgi:protein-tyrosine phosphatase